MTGGGSERQMTGVLKYLDREKFEPLLYLVYREGEMLAEVPQDVPIFAFRDEFRQPRWNYPGRIHAATVRHLAEVIRRERIDLVYDRTYNMSIITGGATRKAPCRRVSVVVTDPRNDFERNTRRFKSIRRRLLARSYREADRVAAVSEGVRRATIEYFRLPPEKVTTVENFLDLDRLDRLLQAPVPFPPDEAFHLVAAGRLHPQKGLDLLLEAVRRVACEGGRKELRLHLLGTGPQEAELRAFVARHALEPFVVFEGFQANVPAWLAAADLVCLPSRYEGMPNVVLEAMYCGTPVLAADCPSGPRELLEDGRLGELIPSDNVEALAAALENAVTHDARRQDRIAEAKQHVVKRFGPETGIQRLQALLLEAAG
jgi:glycosyltransferase involved in cell wall biosynthesis